MEHHIRSRLVRGAVLLGTFISLAACSSISVDTDWDTSVDFSKFQTFAFIEDSERSFNRLIDERIRTAISADLVSKGFRQLEVYEDADLAVGYDVTTEQRSTYHTVYSGWGRSGFATSNVRMGASVGASNTMRTDYTVGTLVIAAFRMADKALIWEGSGSDVVSESSSPEETTQQINAVVQKTLEGFPPGV